MLYILLVGIKLAFHISNISVISFCHGQSKAQIVLIKEPFKLLQQHLAVSLVDFGALRNNIFVLRISVCKKPSFIFQIFEQKPHLLYTLITFIG